ncbi:invasion associated locus B family protein [Roseivivax sediminis]|uniref:Invasion protein IalB, involved in pathogenesis n=1 Tax=Roseivivax sediminis TaxID=936889 RepID=A0A1I1XKM9_9RHOB|nr:invasion associated locus B family protein [Roseivivax sediminis]SFE07852.1 Invasion protein IalB, involved in pathogenesis [Roseivivax sediminis]
MTIRLTHLSLIAALMAAGPALAQDDTADAPAEGAAEAPADDAAPTEGGEDAPGPNPDADMGLQGMQQSQPEAFVKAENEDWQVQCIRFPDGTEAQCQMFQLLTANDDQPLAEAYLFKPPQGSQFAAGLNIVVPLRTLLTQPLEISIDGGAPQQIPYMMCSGEGCVARAGIAAAQLNQFKAGAEARVTIVPADAPDQQVSTTMSLAGFTDSFDTLEPAELPTQPGQGAAQQ